MQSLLPAHLSDMPANQQLLLIAQAKEQLEKDLNLTLATLPDDAPPAFAIQHLIGELEHRLGDTTYSGRVAQWAYRVDLPEPDLRAWMLGGDTLQLAKAFVWRALQKVYLRSRFSGH